MDLVKKQNRLNSKRGYYERRGKEWRDIGGICNEEVLKRANEDRT